MAVIVSDAGGNWSAAGCWVGGVKPTAADDVTVTGTSGSFTIDAASVCRSLDMTGYNVSHTLTHNNFTLTIGDSTTPANNIALKLVGIYTQSSTTSSIIFTSSATGVHTIDTNGKNIRAITFINTASYQFVTSAVILDGSLTINAGTVDFNGLSFSMTNLSSSGGARTLSFGSSVITTTQNGSNFIFLTGVIISPNTATLIGSSIGPGIQTVDGLDLKGASIKFIGGAGTCNIPGSFTCKDLIIDPTTTKTIAITAGKTVTLTGKLYCDPQAGLVTFTGGNISATGTHNLYQVAAAVTTTFTGGATWNLRNNCSVTQATANTYGLTIVVGTNFIDYVNGNDSLYLAYGFYKVAYTGATGTCPVENEICSGQTSGSIAGVSHVNPYEWSGGTGTLYFSYKSGSFAADNATQINCLTGGGSFHIGSADFVNAAWATMTSGALAARIGYGDIMRIAQSPVPTNIGTGTWTDQPTTLPASKTITSSVASGTTVQINATSHGFSNGDCVYIQDHITSLTVNGTWSISNVATSSFTLDGSTYVATGSTGTATLVNRGVVKLATAQTLDISRCETSWTPNASGDAPTGVSAYTTDYKEGDACCRVVLDAAVQTNTLQCYLPVTIAGATANNYSKLSFWFKNSAAVTYTNSTTFMWYVALCSNADGTGVIDTFPIPAIPSTARWIPFTLSRCANSAGSFVQGGNLGGNASTAIASIALYSAATAPTNSSTIYIDNIIACTTSGLNLQSLLSKNTLSQGSTSDTGYANEGWYGIQSISQDGKVIRLDNDTNTLGNYGVTLRGMGYSGTGGDFITYIRETIKNVMPASTSTAVNSCLDSGILNHNIEYQGGYSLTTGSQTGETFFDGLNGNGYGVNVSSINYTTINFLSACRFNYGVFYSSGSNNIITTLTNANNNAYGVYYSTSSNNIITTLTNANNNNNSGVYYNSSSNNIITTLTNANNNTTAGVYYNSSSNNIITTLTNANNNTYGISSAYGGKNYIMNVSITGTEYLNQSATSLDSSMVYIGRYNGTSYGKIFTNYATIVSQAGTLTHSSGKEWKIEITNVLRNSAYPVRFPIARIAVNANTIVTVQLWMKKSDGANIIARLACMGNQISGLTSNIYSTDLTDTNEGQVTLTLDKPTEAGVIEIEVQAYCLAATYNIIFDTINITQS